jgi:hypothetical protein
VEQKTLRQNNGDIMDLKFSNKLSEEFIRKFKSSIFADEAKKLTANKLPDSKYLIEKEINEKPCVHCGRMNDVTSKVCWGFTCGIENPIRE